MKRRFCAVVTLLLTFSFCITSFGNEKAEDYFPSTLDSFWIYEDQDGKELKRTVIEGEEIAGKIYNAFSYEPELKDWINYMRFMRPELFNVNDKGITFSVKEGVEKAVNARLSKEMDFLFDAALQEGVQGFSKPTINITVEAEDNMQLLLTPLDANEEWDVLTIKAKIEVLENGELQGAVDYTIVETGIILGAEKVETAAGTYEDCLKVKYKTETTVTMDPNEDDMNPPGETVTTVWFAPNVGIVKIHQKVGNMFLDMLPTEVGLPFIIPQAKETTLELKEFKIKIEDSATTIPLKKDEETLEKRVEETQKNIEENYGYFPSTLDSFWIYEDKDGEELKRTVIEGEEIAEETYHAFSYEPELKDWANFSRFIHPDLFKVSNLGITLTIKEDVEKAVKKRLTKEMEVLSELIKIDDPTAADELTYSIKVEAEEDLKLLSIPIVLYEEWDAIEIKSSLTFALDPDDVYTVDFTIIESGMVEAKETVKTSAGTFENCLKVVYRTETSAVFDEDNPPGEVDPPGETITTVWYAPNVGIVKYHQQRNYTFLELIPDDDDLAVQHPPETRILELKKYEIKKTEKNIEEIYEYFPSTLDSFWIYEDQDGNELKRTVIEGEEIAEETYHAVSYEPELKDWVNYMRFIHPEFFNVNDKGITLSVKEGVEKAVKARLTKETDIFIEAVNLGSLDDDSPTVNITVEAEDDLHLLFTPITINEEWNVFSFKVQLEFIEDEISQVTIDYVITETGIVLGTETVETPAGTFENCLKVKYQTETTVVFQPEENDFNPPGETGTTVWYAPNVGIVKIHQKSGNMFLDLMPDDASLPIVPPPPKETTLELKKFDIKAEEVDEKENN